MLSVHRSAAARRTHARGRQARHGGRVAAVVKGSGRGVPISKIESTYLRAVEESALVMGVSRGGLPRPWLLGTTTTGSRGAPLEGHRLAAAQVAAPVVAARRLHLVERHVGREHARDAQVDAAVLVERHARVARQPERVPKLKGRSGGAGGEQWSGEREERQPRLLRPRQAQGGVLYLAGVRPGRGGGGRARLARRARDAARLEQRHPLLETLRQHGARAT